MFRFPGQQKALHCYIIMSIWILMLVAGIYKFLEPHQRSAPEPSVNTDPSHNLEFDVKTKRIFKLCNQPHEISDGDEGTVESNKWVLKGLLVLIRHGDRGPLQHLKNVSAIHCGTPETDLLTAYKSYLHNLTVSGKVSWIGPGPFHGFPLLPTLANRCQLGQLTMQGVSQLLALGHILKRSYSFIWPKIQNLSQSEVVVYSTRYRRTFQSALAFLYGLIPGEALAKLNVYESQSMSFCFKDCGCPISDKYSKAVQQSINKDLRSHPAVSLLAETTGRAIFSSVVEQASLTSDPHSVRDALLTYVCHGSPLPCENTNSCVRRQNVVGIFAYTDWVTHQKWKNVNWRRFCLLKSYGLIKNIVSQMLHMVSSNGPYLVLYSGHDHTLEQLTAALGLQNDPLLFRYAGRIVFEVYNDNREPQNGVKGVYFRVLSNGKDVTKQIAFCKDLVKVTSKINLCKIEDIIRFIHDDYFVHFNVTNFKDACFAKNV